MMTEINKLQRVYKDIQYITNNIHESMSEDELEDIRDSIKDKANTIYQIAITMQEKALKKVKPYSEEMISWRDVFRDSQDSMYEEEVVKIINEEITKEYNKLKKEYYCGKINSRYENDNVVHKDIKSAN